MLYVIEASLPPGRPKLANLLHDVNNTFTDVKKRHQGKSINDFYTSPTTHAHRTEPHTDGPKMLCVARKISHTHATCVEANTDSGSRRIAVGYKYIPESCGG